MSTRFCRLDSDDGCLFFDLFQLNQCSLTAPGTHLAGRLPRFRRANVRFPERPRSALPWSSLVDGALFRFVIEEHAIAVGILDQALSNPDHANVLFFERDDIHVEQFGERFNFLLVDPDITGRAGTTIAALGASKFQTVLVPGFC